MSYKEYQDKNMLEAADIESPDLQIYKYKLYKNKP